MNRSRRYILQTLTLALLAACVGLAAGCRSSGAHATGTYAGPRTVFVLIEEGNPADMQSTQYKWRTDIKAYMTATLPQRLSRYGFRASMIRTREEFTPAPDSQLLVVAYTAYNPGSTAARVMVGYGAGACSLDLACTLFRAGPEPVADWKDGVGSSKGWRQVVLKLNDNIGRKLVQIRPTAAQDPAL